MPTLEGLEDSYRDGILMAVSSAAHAGVQFVLPEELLSLAPKLLGQTHAKIVQNGGYAHLEAFQGGHVAW